MPAPLPALDSSRVGPASALNQDRHTEQVEKDEPALTSSQSSINEDDKQMAAFGYKSQLARRWHTLESFAVSFCAMNFLGATRGTIFLGVLAGGPAAAWSVSIP
ncbi:hypothetical protein QFC20_006761 [Naganishia adeliensis]|uniref:Uncharacterized protein n=1 Tax=Naganishia adeliensis TaxID=92952 RepID=A0ACC2V7N9_9TREE|nr:hypothetical protein QFC20_006761 [Naganishia adeliensis]